MHHAKLLDPQPVPVRTDIFLHDLDARTLESLRRALVHGLVPTALDFGENDESIVVLRLARPRAGEACPVVGVEFYPEESEVVGKVYDAESQITYATEPRDAHEAGSFRGTVSRLLRELAAKIAGDPSF